MCVCGCVYVCVCGVGVCMCVGGVGVCMCGVSLRASTATLNT